MENVSPEMLWGIGIVVLAVAMVVGITRYRSRNRANRPVTEAATRERYRDEAQYAREGEKEFKKQVKPS